MSKRWILAGSVDQTIDIFVQDSSVITGAGLAGLVYNSAGLTCYYRKGATGTPTALTLSTQTVGGAHSDGGFVAVDGTNCPGQYRLDLSDTIVATAGMVTLYLRGAANMAPVVLEIEVVSVNIFDSVRLGLTALPNVAAGSSGGVPVIGTGANNFKSDSSANITVGGYASGQAPLQPTTAGRTLDVSAGGEAGVDWSNIGGQSTGVNLSNTTTNIVNNIGASGLSDIGDTVDTALGAYGVGGVATVTNQNTLLSRIGVPVDLGGGASVAANLALIEGQTDDIGAAGAGLTAIPDSAGATTLLSRLSATRAGFLDNLSAGPVALEASVQSVLSKLLKYFQLALRKDAAIATDNATELTAINANGGSGAGGYVSTTDSQEGIRDAGFSTLSQADVRSAVGLGSANLDTQLDALPTNAELATALAAADDATLSAIGALNNLSAAQVNAEVDTALADVGVTTTVTGRIDAAVSSRSSHSAADVWAVTTRTLSSFGTLVSDVATAVWAAGTRTLTGFGTLVADIWANATRTLTAFGFSVTVGTNNDKTGYALTSGERDSIAAAILATVVTQSNVTSDTTLTVMKALLAAWVQAAGDWAIVGTTLTLKNPDGTTFRTFTLDDADAPTSRT